MRVYGCGQSKRGFQTVAVVVRVAILIAASPVSAQPSHDGDAVIHDFGRELGRSVGVSGSLALSQVREAVVAISASLEACETSCLTPAGEFGLWCPKKPEEFSLDVAGDGKTVGYRQSTNEPPNPRPATEDVKQCLSRAVQRIRFPASEGTSTVSFGVPFASAEELRPIAARQAARTEENRATAQNARMAEEAARRDPAKVLVRLRTASGIEKLDAIIDICQLYNDKRGGPKPQFDGSRLYRLSQEENFDHFDRVTGNCFASIVVRNLVGGPGMHYVGTPTDIDGTGVTMVYSVEHATLAARFSGAIRVPRRRYLLPVGIADGYSTRTNQFHEKIRLPTFQLVAVVGFNGFAELPDGKTEWRDLEVAVDEAAMKRITRAISQHPAAPSVDASARPR